MLPWRSIALGLATAEERVCYTAHLMRQTPPEADAADLGAARGEYARKLMECRDMLETELARLLPEPVEEKVAGYLTQGSGA